MVSILLTCLSLSSNRRLLFGDVDALFEQVALDRVGVTATLCLACDDVRRV